MITYEKILADLSWVLMQEKTLFEPAEADLSWFFPKNRSSLDTILEKNSTYIKELITEDTFLKRSYKLGYYYEELFRVWCILHPELDLLAANFSIENEDKSTLGSLDFLIYSKTKNRHFHLEIAIKFYLLHGKATNLKDWIGPNMRDNFDKKFNKLCGHQLLLGNHEKVAEFVGKKPVFSLAFIGGILFYKLEKRKIDLQANPLFNPYHHKGWWCRAKDFYINFDDLQHFIILEKLNWFALPDFFEDDVLNMDTLQEKFNGKPPFEKPLLLCALRYEKGKGWLEQSRGFVVPNTWPTI